MKEETYFCLALTLVPGLGRRRLPQLLSQAGSPQDLLRLLPGQLARLELTREAGDFLRQGGALRAADAVLRQVRKQSVGLYSIFDEDFPQLLRNIYDTPVILYYLGDIEALGQPSVAVVGSRRCTLYGKEVTHSFARQLASLGLNVVSGLARGADTQAHLGALEAGGLTVAVLGSGVDVVYPRENRKLFQKIREQGCILSEFHCGTFPAPQNFPVRNRVISGLCLGTLVTEASEYSGSLITARLALEQDREVWAVPGNITSPASHGTNCLIRQGAKVALDIQDVLEELPLEVLDRLSAGSPGDPSAGPVPLTPEEEKVLGLLMPDKAVHTDQLLQESGLELNRLTEVLLELEIKGLVVQLPGGRFNRRFF